MNSFRYIAFEGIDACGKSTQANLLYERLRKSGEPVHLTKEPGGVIKGFRDLLLRGKLTPKSRMFLFCADRATTIREVKKHLEKEHVITDRCFFSTIAYQAFGEGIDVDFVEQASLFSAEQMIPDLTFIIDISIDTMMNRLSKKNMDNIERKGEEFFERVQEGYRYIASSFRNIHVINGEKSIEEIFEEVVEIWKSEDSMYML